MGRLDGKVAIVTGSGSGMGRASARLFSAEGASVVCADVTGQETETAAEVGGSAVHADVSKAAEVEALVAAALDRHGRLDVLFNNAGISGPLQQPLHESTEADFDRLVAVNLKGVFLGIKYAVPAMLAGGGGSIINTASASGLVGWQGLAAYSASKGGVVALTRSAALDYATQGIRVNAICPGMVFTGMAGADPAGSTDAPEIELPFPMKRFGRATEIASAALFLASDESSFVTGIALPVDGGYVAE